MTWRSRFLRLTRHLLHHSGLQHRGTSDLIGAMNGFARKSVSESVVAVAAILCFSGSGEVVHCAPEYEAEFLFPLESWHNHGSCIVECPDGTLLTCWFHGSGERKSDDVAIFGARKKPGGQWSKPFVMADTPEFPDTNCCMIIDSEKRLWLLWPTIQANLWESALMKYKISTDYEKMEDAPNWSVEKVLHIKPGERFPKLIRRKTAEYLSDKTLSSFLIGAAAHNFKQADDKLTRRLGWFTRAHPYVDPSGRMVVGLYSDGFSFALTAVTDDNGASWKFSEPIVGDGNIQPSFARRKDGTLVAYMRDNGSPPNRVHVAESGDVGLTWGKVYDHPELANPGAGLELANLRDGRFIVVYNDTESGRHRLAVAVSNDEGNTFPIKRYLEKTEPGGGEFHYPSIIESKDGSLHCTYSCFVRKDGKRLKSIKYAKFNMDWIENGGN